MKLAISSDQWGYFCIHGYDVAVLVGPNENGEIKLDASATGSFPLAFRPSDLKEGSSSTAGEDVVVAALRVLPT